MRVLLLRRQDVGGVATLSEALVPVLRRIGIDAVTMDGTAWIPNETGLAEDRKVSKTLREVGDGFDLVHAFGYRAAWACAEAFGYGEAWVYTAYDMPKTTHRMLIDKLNHAQLGMCSSRAVMHALDEAGALDLSVHTPGVPAKPEMSKHDARNRLGIPTEGTVVAALGRLVPERGFDSLLRAMDEVAEEHPHARLFVAGEGPERQHLEGLSGPNVKLLGKVRNAQEVMAASDLFVVPSIRAGFSMAAAEAMNIGVPVLMRNVDGLAEMADEGVSAIYFESDSGLGEAIKNALSMPLMMESISSAAKVRAALRFDIQDCAEGIASTYRSVLE